MLDRRQNHGASREAEGRILRINGFQPRNESTGIEKSCGSKIRARRATSRAFVNARHQRRTTVWRRIPPHEGLSAVELAIKVAGPVVFLTVPVLRDREQPQRSMIQLS